MQNTLNIVQISISVLLTITILLQQRGAGGLGGAFGGSSSGNAYSTKRGMEKLLFRSSIVLAVLFLISAFLRLIF